MAAAFRDRPTPDLGVEEPICRVLIADGHERYRRSLAALCQHRGCFDVVGEVANGPEAVDLAYRLSPDLIVLDVATLGTGWMTSAREIAAQTNSKVVLLTVHGDDDRAAAARQAGATACLPKDMDPDELLDRLCALSRDGAGRRAPSPRLRRIATPGRDELPQPLDRITLRHGADTGGLSKSRARLLAALRDDATTCALAPATALALARAAPRDLREYWIGHVADGLRPRDSLGSPAGSLYLLLDQGEQAVRGRWAAQAERYGDLRTILATLADPVLSLLGPPGSSKTSLLRRLALDTAIEALRDEAGGGPIPFLVSLSAYAPARPGKSFPEPMAWLSDKWSTRYPELPSLASLIDDGRVLLLFDGLNEIRTTTEADRQHAVARWQRFATRVAALGAGNRIVFASRSLDDSQPLSTPGLRVPHIQVEPLSDRQVRRHLEHQLPDCWEETWRRLRGTPELELLRTPFFLSLYVAELEAGGKPVAGDAALITAFVRRALEREVLRGHAFFAGGALLTEADLRQLQTGAWPNAFALPDRGFLIRHLTRLAYELQRTRGGHETRRIRIGYGDALDLIRVPHDQIIVQAGAAIHVLERDTVSGELMFVHQLIQEYFAARVLAQAPEPALARSAWRADRVEPPLREVIDGLAPADALPPLPTTGWDGTMRLAAVMAEDPDRFVGRLMDANLTLAGRCAAQPELRDRLGAQVLDALRQALVARSRDEAADLRERLASGDALGALGDPRFEPRGGAFDTHVLPPMAELPAGDYVLGADTPFRAYNQRQGAHVPRHGVALPAFAIGRFAVTNAEWACFMDAGGYADERWWDTRAARAWRRGEGTAYGLRVGVRYWWERFRSEPRLLEQRHESGVFDDDLYARWRARIDMPEAELASDLAERFPDRRHAEPRYWRDERYNQPSQPVVGVCWFEARAYCAWLAAQTGLPFRLPTEAEWEAAARGPEGHGFAAGGESRFALDCNTVEAHVRRPSPVGVFPTSDSPMGVSDLTGNTWDWTSSAWGEDPDTPAFGYPYSATDGREDVDVSARVRRVARGGSWYGERGDARAAFRFNLTPDMWSFDRGLRVALSLDRAPSMGEPT